MNTGQGIKDDYEMKGVLMYPAAGHHVKAICIQ